jgi:hypothetical protein
MSSRRDSPAYREGPTSGRVMRAASGQQGRATSSILPACEEGVSADQFTCFTTFVA